jgi:hypothetical protein
LRRAFISTHVSSRRAFRKQARSTYSGFHSEQGRKYLIAYTILWVITVVTNARLGQSAGASQWPAQNIVIVPMTIASGVAAIFISSRSVEILTLAIQIGSWIWYFGALRTSLSG